MLISGTWTLIGNPDTNKVIYKVEKWFPKSVIQAKAKRDGVINLQNYNFSYLLSVTAGGPESPR